MTNIPRCTVSRWKWSVSLNLYNYNLQVIIIVKYPTLTEMLNSNESAIILLTCVKM